MSLPKKVKIVEVSPRDGLQNEAKILPADIKIELINRLTETGLQVIEATSFVSPKWIPQFADSQKVYEGITKKSGVSYPVLIPNAQGLNSALEVGVKEIAVFTTPSEQFSQRNTNCSVAESLKRIAEVCTIARNNNIKVRGYISCVMGCPYEGDISPEKVDSVANELLAMGIYEISLGDTIGTGTILKTQRLLDVVGNNISMDKLAIHFHDTYAMALPNIYAALQYGVSVIDSSVAGIGGCPYAKGASGNVATEDVIYMLNGLGIETGIDLNKLVLVGKFITNELGKLPQSKVSIAIQSNS